ncbi:MAG: IclR family transcriptional regulator [Spongiibacteraceae bacterium]
MKNSEPTSSTKKQKVVKSAIRTVQLFSVFAEKKQPLSLAEIAERMKAPKSSCFELIQTLMHLGYIIGIDGGKSYYPSRRLYDTAAQINEFNPIKEKVHNALEGLRDSTGETIFIGRLQGNQVAYTAVFEGTHAMRFTANSGDLKAIHASALGKALLGSLDEAAQNQLITELKLNRYSEHTITRKKDLKENLIECEKQGIYTTIGEHVADVMALAVPVKIQGNQLAIGMAGPIPRMQKNLKAYSQALKGVAAAITS